MRTSPLDLLRAYVDAHNSGVRTGDFEAMLALFDGDAVFELVGLDPGPFEGLDAIRAAFAGMPPSDELVILGAREIAGEVVAAYGWRRSRATGTLSLTSRGAAIVRVVVRRG